MSGGHIEHLLDRKLKLNNEKLGLEAYNVIIVILNIKTSEIN